jgi:hypothetical protein
VTTPYAAARKAYADAHPVTLLDFTCAQCGADVGEPCVSPLERKRTYGHASRQDKVIRAKRKIHNQGTRYADQITA